MKMHVLTAAVLAALASQAVLAASEGGDTWSAVEPVQQPTYSVLKPAAPAPDAAFGGSEGGDTWSSLQALRETTAQQASIQDRPGRTDTRYAGEVGGSEGGDTWSRFEPQLQGPPIGSAGLTSGPRFGQR